MALHPTTQSSTPLTHTAVAWHACLPPVARAPTSSLLWLLKDRDTSWMFLILVLRGETQIGERYATFVNDPISIVVSNGVCGQAQYVQS